MSRIRYALLLPILQICLAVSVSEWNAYAYSHIMLKREYLPVTTPFLLYRGVNAPALLFEMLCVRYLPIYRVNQPPATIFGLGWDEVVFLIAAVFTWFIVGPVLDRYRRRSKVFPTGIPALRILVTSCIGILGIFLLCGGIFALSRARLSPNPVGQVCEGTLFVAWSVVLQVITAFRLRTTVHRYFMGAPQRS